MITPHSNSIPPDLNRSADEIADEQYAHGALEFLHHDTPESQSDRIDRVMASIDGHGAYAPSPRQPSRLWILVSAMAAAIVIAIWIVRPRHDATAERILRQAAESGQITNDLRYAFHVEFAPDTKLATREHSHDHATGETASIEGILDIRDHQHALLRFHSRNQENQEQPKIAGRSDTGEWTIHSNRAVHGKLAGIGWPEWLSIDAHINLLEPSARDLHELLQRYRVHDRGRQQLAEHGDQAFAHILAEADGHNAAQPSTIALWLHPQSHRIHRMVLDWHREHGHGHGHTPHAEHEHRHENEHTHGHKPETGVVHELHQFLSRLTHMTAGHFEPPARIVFELKEHPAFPADWFEAKTHIKNR